MKIDYKNLCKNYNKEVGCYGTFDGNCIKELCFTYKLLQELKQKEQECEELKAKCKKYVEVNEQKTKYYAELKAENTKLKEELNKKQTNYYDDLDSLGSHGLSDW